MNIGKVYAFKEGIVTESNLVLTEEDAFEQIELNGKNFCGPFLGSGELIVKKSNIIKSNFTVDIYKEYIDKGFSIIKKSNDVLKEEDSFLISPTAKEECIIAKNITEKDSDNMLRILEQLDKDENIKQKFIYNMNINEFGKDDYDFFDSYQKRGSCILDIAPYFLNEKTNNLSELEREVVNKYRNFNLEDLLINKTPEAYKLDNGNAGAIIISPDKIYKSTCQKMQHSGEIKKLINEVNATIDQDMNIMDLTEESDSIIIQVNFEELIIWMPEVITNYQASQINDIALFVEQLNKKNAKPITVYAARCHDGDFDHLLNASYDDTFEIAQDNLELLKETAYNMRNIETNKGIAI